jgi:hypothetical protein
MAESIRLTDIGGEADSVRQKIPLNSIAFVVSFS